MGRIAAEEDVCCLVVTKKLRVQSREEVLIVRQKPRKAREDLFSIFLDGKGKSAYKTM